MTTTKTSPFKFESISLETGQCDVRFINKHGPIYTGEKTVEDFPATNTNPNEDLIYAFDIPVDQNGNFISENDLIEYIGKQYPHELFDEIERRKNAPKTLNVQYLTSTNINYELVVPTVTAEDPWVTLRRTRNELLRLTDWTQLLDANPPGGRAAWEAYRQQLRDLPENTVDATNITWPVAPAEIAYV